MEYEEFLQRLREKIKEKGFDQTKLSKRLGIKNNQILNTQLHDTTKLYVFTLFQISEIIGINIRDLFDEAQNSNMVMEEDSPPYHLKNNSNLCIEQLEFMREYVREQIQIIKLLSHEKCNFNADADSNNNSNEPGAR